MLRLRYLLILALLGCSALACAQIVECVDANGKKIYAQSCPDEAEKKRDVLTPPKTGGSKPADESWKDKEKEFEKRRQERLRVEAAASKQQKTDEQAAQRCANAKSRLEALESGKQAKRVDPVTGEHVPMDDSARQTEIDRLNAEVQNSCQ